MLALPSALVQTLHDIHEGVAVWLEAFPAYVQACQQRWGVHVTGLVPDLSYNVVAYAEGEDGRAYILKMSPPSEAFSWEVAALRHYRGRGICKLIHADESVAAMLLERISPGVSLRHTDDDEAATRSAAQIMRQLWRPIPEPHPFVRLEQWANGLTRLRKRFEDGTGPLPAELVGQAEGIFRERLGSTPATLLHGDLHHSNILSATRAPYLAIDPKGVVGDAGYEVGAFLRNPAPEIASHPALEARLARRVAILSEMLNMSPGDIAAWGTAHAVLAAWWSLEDHGDGHQAAMTCARVLAKMC